MTENELPAHDRAAQPTVLVSGQASELLRRVPLQLLAARVEPGDAAVVVTAREDPGVVARRLRGAVSDLDASLVATVDATSKETSALARVDETRWHVPSPVSFRHIHAAIDVALEELRGRGAGRVHLLFDVLTTQFRLAEADVVHRRTHELAMTAGAAAGLGLFALEPSAATDREVEQVRHLVDVEVAVRRTERGPEVRWRGLVGDSDGWVGLADWGHRFDALGRSLG